MAQSVIAVTAAPNPNALTGVSLTLTACDATNGNSIVSTNAERLIVVNTAAGAGTFTITGPNDPYGRAGNFVMSVPGSASLAAVSIIITPLLTSALWATGGLILTPASNVATLLVGAVRGW